MFASFFGHYLLENGDITQDQLLEIIDASKSAHVKLGLLAVASGLLDQKQADEVNRLQQQMDKRFGDIAIEKGYLTQEQVSELLSKQGDAYMTFVQVVTDKNVMTLEEVQKKVGEYQSASGFSDEELEIVKSGDLDSIVPLFAKAPALSNIHRSYIGLVMRNLMRFIDTDICMEEVTQLEDTSVECGVVQSMFGDQQMFTGIFGDSDVILDIASTFGNEDFTKVNADSLDSLGEFLNVSNGLFVSDESEEGIELDLEPPVMYPEHKVVSSEGVAYKIPVYLSGKKVNVIFSVNTTVDLI